MVGGSASTTGRIAPSNKGEDYGSHTFNSSNEAQTVFDLGTETDSIAIKAPEGNGGLVYIGFDDQVSTGNGFELSAGESITMDIDVNELTIWGVADTVNDEVRFLAIS